MEKNKPKILTISELIRKSLPLTGTSSLNSSSSSRKNPQSHQQPLNSSTSSTSEQNPKPKTLSSLNYSTLIIGTLTLPTESTCSSYCFSFSDGLSKVCCDVIDFDIKLIGKQINVLSWNFIPFRCDGHDSGFLEIIKWKFLESDFQITRCSTTNAFPLTISSSSNCSSDELLKTNSRVLGRLVCVSPVSVVPCTIQKSDSFTGRKNVSGFLAEFFVCKCKLCSSKVSVTSLRNSLRGEKCLHLFNMKVTVYFFESASSSHPLLCKVLGNVVCITGLRKKLIFIGKDISREMFVTTEKATLHMPLCGLEHLPLHRDEIKGKGEFGTYMGIVSGVYMQGQVVELDDNVWLLLTDCLLAPPHFIRVGALICLKNVHFICPKFSWTRILLLGACVKTTINVISFSPLESQCYIRCKTDSMLGKFIDSSEYSARFWLLLTISTFKKKFVGLFLEKEILGSKHVVPLSTFINHCEAMGVKVILRMQNSNEKFTKNKFCLCEGKSYNRLVRRIISSEDLGVVLMGTLKISPFSGRLQMVDASGSIDVVVPDLPSDNNTSNVYEVRNYTVVIEGLPEETDASVMYESELCSFSCKSIFHPPTPKMGIKPTSTYVHFYMRNTTCLNTHLCLPGSDNLTASKDGLFHIILVTHKFPARQKSQFKRKDKLSSFVEALLLPWFLYLPVEHKDIHVTRFSKEKNLKEHLVYTCRRNSLEDHSCKRSKFTRESTRAMTSTLKVNLGDADSGSYVWFNNCDSPNSRTNSDHKPSELDSSDKGSCVVLMRSFNNQRQARPGALLNVEFNVMDGVVSKLSARKVMLEFNLESFSNYQVIQVGGYYIMRYGKEVVPKAKDFHYVTSCKTLVTSQTPLWSVSFSCDEYIPLSELLQENLLQVASTETDMVPCECLSTGDLFVQRSPSQNPETCFFDIKIHLSNATMDLLKLDMEAAKNGLVKPISISGGTDKSLTFMMSSGTTDPGCVMPQGSLVSLHGNVVDVHSFDRYSVDSKTHLCFKGRDDIQHTEFCQGLPRSICIHVSNNHHVVKLHGSISKCAFPIGMGPGASATFHRVLVVGQYEMMLTPVSFIVINSIKKDDMEYSECSHLQLGSSSLSGDSLGMISSWLFSELIQPLETNTARFHCRVVAIHILVLEKQKLDFDKSHLKEQAQAPGIDIPCAAFILDDGSLPCCCWASAERAAMLLRLDEETMVKAICSDRWRLKRSTAGKNPNNASYHLQKILRKYNRITIKNFGTLFDTSCQDLTFSVNSDGVLSSSEENLLKLILNNACCGSVLNVVGSIMDSNATGRLEELSGMGMAMDSMQNIWATEIQYADHRIEAAKLIQEITSCGDNKARLDALAKVHDKSTT
ncbi:Cst complex subunit ctc1 [Thalictrum thalictroides]|uniref:CST complex subunit CTC1 n=1 Tax=Thalictrum thalictroides TaxID=46969 RepID=A0A7J6UQJ4_THATH|nr:Cst complex subunit ctc1 [Thalictrum thalictroides]